MTPDGRITDANPAMAEILGYPDRETLLSVDTRKLFANSGKGRRWLAAARRSGVVERLELELRRYDGKLIWTEINARAVNDNQGRTQHWDGSAEDITVRKRAEEVLRDSREELRALAAYLQSVREEERTRVAREMHGEVGQALAGLKTELASLERKLIQGSGPASLSLVLERLKGLPEAVAAMLVTVEKITTELRPTKPPSRGRSGSSKSERESNVYSIPKSGRPSWIRIAPRRYFEFFRRPSPTSSGRPRPLRRVSTFAGKVTNLSLRWRTMGVASLDATPLADCRWMFWVCANAPPASAAKSTLSAVQAAELWWVCASRSIAPAN